MSCLSSPAKVCVCVCVRAHTHARIHTCVYACLFVNSYALGFVYALVCLFYIICSTRSSLVDSVCGNNDFIINQSPSDETLSSTNYWRVMLAPGSEKKNPPLEQQDGSGSKARKAWMALDAEKNPSQSVSMRQKKRKVEEDADMQGWIDEIYEDEKVARQIIQKS